MKRIILCVLLCTIFGTGCSLQKRFAIKQCHITLSGIKVNHIGKHDIDLTLKLKIDNQHDFEIIIERMFFDFFIEDQRTAQIKIDRVVVPPLSKKKLGINISLAYRDFREAIKIILKDRGNTIYVLDGYVCFGFESSCVEIPVRIERTLSKKKNVSGKTT